VGYHLYLVIQPGTTTIEERKEPIETVEEQRELYEYQAEHPVKGEVFVPAAVIKISPWSIVFLSLAVGLTLAVGPRALLPPANVTSDSTASEEWWFAWYSALVALLPPAIAPTFQWLFPLVLFVVLILVPFLDRSPHRGWQNRPIATTLVVFLVLAVLGLSWLRYRSPWTAWPAAEPPPVPPGIVLAAEAEAGRLLFRQYGCTSCHKVLGFGPSRVGTDLARTRHIYSEAELRHYVLHPPPGVAMPAYAGRIEDSDLARVVAFVLVAQTFGEPRE
jgi:mono/diheme cytochrome c family protein